jgi:hypothetical protein
VLGEQDLPHPLLVGRIGVRVQQTDADGRHAVVAEPAGDQASAVGVKGPQLGTGVVQPAADGADPVGGDDARRLDPEVAVAVAVRHALAGDLQQVFEALSGDETQAGHVAL